MAEELFPKQLDITEEPLNTDQNDDAFDDCKSS